MAIGQGYVTTTPLQLAAMMAGLATRGRMFNPYVVDKIVTPAGEVTFQSQPSLRRQVTLKNSTWDALYPALKAVVTDATGKAADIPYLDVYGKTGTAQNSHGEDHAWFAAFAGYKDEPPSVAVCLFVENGGHGGVTAAPIVRKIFETALPARKASS
jgi:cell division protein FtsI/penicillin-binding protein 2